MTVSFEDWLLIKALVSHLHTSMLDTESCDGCQLAEILERVEKENNDKPK